MSKPSRTDPKPSRTTTAGARRRGSARRRVAGVLGVLALVVAIGSVAACTSTGVAQAPTASQAPAASQAPNALPAEISVADAAKLRGDGAFVLDVRQPDEWAAAHIPDSTLIPLGELASRVAEVPKDQAVVVVCRSGNRSAQGRDILESAGYTNVTSMAGGLVDWQAAGQPTVSGS